MATDIIARGMITEYIAGTNINFTENRDGTVEISASGSISSEDSVARDAIGNHKSDTSNPHNVTPAQIGLGNVDNTSDLDKPISTAVKQAIDNKADKTIATTSADGLMSASDKGKLDNADNTYALKSKYGDTTIDVGRKAGSATGEHSTAEGKDSVASGYASHAEGSNTKTWIGATSTLSDRTVVIDDNTTVIVSGTQAYGRNSHAEGCQSLSYGENSHAEGTSSAIGWGSHSEGGLTKAEGEYSHAEGRDTLASGRDSHAGGTGTKALHTSEAAYGRYNLSNDDTLFSIGDGTSDSARHNAFEITTTGGKLHDKDIATTDLIPTELPANGGNADTVGGFDAYHMGTISYNGGHYPPEQFPMYCKYNVYEDGRFALLIDSSYQPNSNYDVRCDYATNAGNADTLGGKSISDFIYAHGYYTGNVDDIQYPFSGIVINATGTPPQTSVWGTMLCYGGGTGSYAQIWVNADDNATMFVRHFDGNRWTEWKNIADGGNADTLDGMHADSFAKANSPSIEGEIRLLREGNATINGSIFTWEDTLRLRNQDPNAENTTYTDLIVTPFGIFTEGYNNGNGIARQQIYGGRPYITGSFSGTSLTTDSFDFQPSFAICNDDKTIKYGEIVHLPTQVSISYKVLFQNLSDTTHQYIIFK